MITLFTLLFLQLLRTYSTVVKMSNGWQNFGYERMAEKAQGAAWALRCTLCATQGGAQATDA